MQIEMGTPTYPERWGRRLAELRAIRGLSQSELATEIGVSRQSVKVWEQGKFPPSDRNRILLARFFRTEPGIMFDLRSDDEPVERSA